VSENRALRGIFGPKEEVAGGWRRLHNEKLHVLYASPNVARMVTSGMMGLVGHIVRMVRWELYTKFWSKNLKGGNHLEDLGA